MAGFDYVPSDRLDPLITQGEISHFFRHSEGKWVNVKNDPIRGVGGGLSGAGKTAG